MRNPERATVAHTYIVANIYSIDAKRVPDAAIQMLAQAVFRFAFAQLISGF
jgi:hypothetical protein